MSQDIPLTAGVTACLCDSLWVLLLLQATLEMSQSNLSYCLHSFLSVHNVYKWHTQTPALRTAI